MRKVFCIGFQKTGTTSLECALGSLGFKVTSVFGKDMSYKTLREQYVEIGLQIAARVDAVQDMPWPLMFRELDTNFPGSKFILTERDEDAWWFSVLGHFGRNPAVLQKLTYGEDAAAPLGNEYRYKSVYRAHNSAVKEYFKDRPEDLLVLDLSKSDGWSEICGFLDVPIPSEPFPNANQPRQLPSFHRRVRRNILFILNKIRNLTHITSSHLR